MRSKEEIISTALSDLDRSLSLREIRRLEDLFSLYEAMANCYYEEIWRNFEASAHASNLEDDYVKYVNNVFIPSAKESSPDTAAALQSILDIDPHFFSNGGVDEATWKYIGSAYGSAAKYLCERNIDKLMNSFNKELEEEHQRFMREEIEEFFDECPDSFVERVLVDDEDEETAE